MPRELYVAVDQGSHASRALAFDATGHCLATTSQAVGTRHDALGHIEHDADELHATVRGCLTELAERLPAARWRAVGLATQRSTIVCWDRISGAALSPAISWRDRRHAAWLTRLQRRAGRVHELTGLPLSPHYGASKLRWCLDQLPAVRRARDAGTLCMGPLASFLLFRLLAERPCIADPANASRTLLWSPATRDWSDELLELFGVPRQVLPSSGLTQQHFGALHVDGSVVPLSACTGDQAAVPFAGGPLQPDVAYVNIGTGAFVLRPIGGALAAPPLLTSVLRADASHVEHVLEGTVNGATAALEEIATTLRVDTAPILAELDDELTVDARTPFFLNGVGGLGSPFWVPDFRSRFEGRGGDRERVRAVLESVAFLIRANLDEMARHLPPPARIIVTGGLSRNRLLRRLLANLSGVPVEFPLEAEATAKGLAWLIAGAPQTWDAGGVETVAAMTQETAQARYREWLELMRAGVDHAAVG
jgi:glycerol kinase